MWIGDPRSLLTSRALTAHGDGRRGPANRGRVGYRRVPDSSFRTLHQSLRQPRAQDPAPLQLQVDAQRVVDVRHHVGRRPPGHRSHPLDGNRPHLLRLGLRVVPQAGRVRGEQRLEGKIRSTLLVTDTMVTTPRPSRAAIAFARSLLPITGNEAAWSVTAADGAANATE